MAARPRRGPSQPEGARGSAVYVGARRARGSRGAEVPGPIRGALCAAGVPQRVSSPGHPAPSATRPPRSQGPAAKTLGTEAGGKASGRAGRARRADRSLTVRPKFTRGPATGARTHGPEGRARTGEVRTRPPPRGPTGSRYLSAAERPRPRQAPRSNGDAGPAGCAPPATADAPQAPGSAPRGPAPSGRAHWPLARGHRPPAPHRPFAPQPRCAHGDEGCVDQGEELRLEGGT